jgi:hypothetical protein
MSVKKFFSSLIDLCTQCRPLSIPLYDRRGDERDIAVVKGFKCVVVLLTVVVVAGW